MKNILLTTINLPGTTTGTIEDNLFVIDLNQSFKINSVTSFIDGLEGDDLVNLSNANGITNGPIYLTLANVEKVIGSTLAESFVEDPNITGISNNFSGGAGNDSLEGGAGDDTLDGGSGYSDRLFGGEGDDEIADPDGVNAAHGGAGDDFINVTFAAAWGSRCDGKITGGYGNDIITLTLNKASFFINLKGDEPVSNVPQDGDDKIFIQGVYGNTVVDLGGGNDAFYGGSGKDGITGGNGDDLLSTAGNNDILEGRAGRDVLVGGIGADTYTGGTEDDLFVSYWATETKLTTVADFTDGVDKLAIVTDNNIFLTDTSLLQTSVKTIAQVQGLMLSYSGKDLAFLQGVTDVSLIDNTDLFTAATSTVEGIAAEFH